MYLHSEEATRDVAPRALVAIGGWVAPLWSLAHAVIRGLRLAAARCAASLPEKLLP
jgi:hypothetical protein